MDMACRSAPVGSCSELSGRMAAMVPVDVGGGSVGWLTVSGFGAGLHPRTGSTRQSLSKRPVLGRLIPWAGMGMDMQNVSMPADTGEYYKLQVFLDPAFVVV